MASDQKTDIEVYAEQTLGIKLLPRQVEIIRAIAMGEDVVIQPQGRYYFGKSKAIEVARAYLSRGLEPAKPISNLTIYTPPPEPQPPRYIFIDDNLRMRG